MDQVFKFRLHALALRKTSVSAHIMANHPQETVPSLQYLAGEIQVREIIVSKGSPFLLFCILDNSRCAAGISDPLSDDELERQLLRLTLIVLL